MYLGRSSYVTYFDIRVEAGCLVLPKVCASVKCEFVYSTDKRRFRYHIGTSTVSVGHPTEEMFFFINHCGIDWGKNGLRISFNT